MRHSFYRALVKSAALAAAIAAARPADASLFSTFNLRQQLLSSYLIPPSTVLNNTVPVTDTAVPFHTTATVDTGHGGSASATYDVYDNGTTAGFSIYVSGSTTAVQNSLEEGHGQAPSTLMFNQPVTCSLSIYLAAPDGKVFSQISFDDFVDAGFAVSPNYNTEYDYSAILRPNVTYYFDEAWQLSNENAASQYANLSSTQSIAFTFMAVPEPSSAGLAAVGVVALARRRGLDLAGNDG